MIPYTPPTFKAGAFNCAICHAYSAHIWTDLIQRIHGSFDATPYSGSKCVQCSEFSFWYKTVLVEPATSTVPPHHLDLPEICTHDYSEARDIFSRSPRGAAALLRLCVQKLVRELGELGENINDDIASLVSKGLPVEIQRALDICRVVGNHAVHPGEMNLNDTPELAAQLFKMINFIVEERVTRPKNIAKLFDALPSGAKAAIEKRDAKPL